MSPTIERLGRGRHRARFEDGRVATAYTISYPNGDRDTVNPTNPLVDKVHTTLVVMDKEDQTIGR